MLQYPNIGPDLLHLGPVRVRWYGIMYLLGFLAGRVILMRLCRQKFLRMAAEKVDDFLIALFVGMLIGARGLYMLVYFEVTPESPMLWWTPFAVWEGGLAFHGGAIGMFTAILIFSRLQKVRFWNLADCLVLAAPVGLFLGRIGNFINAELYGRETTVPWAMQFPVRDFSGAVLYWTTPRHPSQIYEAVAEGLLSLAILWMLKRRVRLQGVLTGIGISWYAIARFCVEFLREKDAQMSYYFGWMTMGQVLSLGMLVVGIIMVVTARKRGVPVDEPWPGRPEPAPESPPPSPAGA
jgi:phosphatidylglycerol---prolipoprotein diacylglyceryl transferase